MSKNSLLQWPFWRISLAARLCGYARLSLRISGFLPLVPSTGGLVVFNAFPHGRAELPLRVRSRLSGFTPEPNQQKTPLASNVAAVLDS